MNSEVYAIALKTALKEIKNACPEVNQSFILMNNGNLIAGDRETIDPNLEKAVNSLQDLTEKTACIGGLDDLSIDGENDKIFVSRINEIYFITAVSKKTDLSNLRAITGVIFPTIIKVLDSISPEAAPPPTLLKPAPSRSMPSETMAENIEETEKAPGEISEPISPEAQEAPEVVTGENVESEAPDQTISSPAQQFIVDIFGGFMVRSDTVQIDSEILQRWSSTLDEKEIYEVDVETFAGKTARCKTKVISDKRLAGRGLIRIPEKLCDMLGLKKGELVRVKPVAS